MQGNDQIRAQWQAAIEGREKQLQSASKSFADIVMMMAHLRSEAGCPWDREQSLASLRQYVREEADEVCLAIDNILEYENTLRSGANLPQANPAPPDVNDTARTDKKGLTIAHHPHHADFNAAASASGAPMPESLAAAEKQKLAGLYDELIEELGDLLLQPIFQADILTAMGHGHVGDSIGLLVQKLIRRHPHVYGGTSVTGSAEVLSNWEQIKQAEKAPPEGTS